MARAMTIDGTEYDFQFTRRWFINRNLSTFREFVYPKWAGKPVTYLEIGVFEGMSLVWMLQKVLTHSDSRAVGIDPWLMTRKLDGEVMESVMRRAHHNLIPWEDRCRLVRGNSAEVLRKMIGRKGFVGVSKNSVDLCMIDGNHNELQVLDDARLCFQLVKLGGLILFDDVENDKEKKDHVKQGLAHFLQEERRLKFIWKDGYVEAYEKG